MEPFLGMISMFGFNFAPRGWASCNGQIMGIPQNTALFSLLGTTYGGNGQTTFALPELRGRVPMHFGAGPGLSNRPQGQMAGTETNTLNIAQMPVHNHPVTVTAGLYGETAAANKLNPLGNMLATANIYAASDPAQNDKQMSADSLKVDVAIGLAGASQPVNNMQPYLAVNFCIALQGIFPSRN